ncbi:MAG: transketolase family protein [Candidatus Thorarchaeota archaeon]
MNKEPRLRDTFGNFLVEEGHKNNDIIVLDADLSASTRTNKFAKEFPSRFFNMGIAEQNMIGGALGFAISGKIPIVSGFSIFTTGRAWEFIRFACHDNLNIKIITTHGGIVGEDGSTHNALEDFSLMTSLPNLTVLVPSDNIELVKILEYAFNVEGPFYIRLPRDSFPRIHNTKYNFQIGKPEVIKEGKDICLIGTGYGSVLAFESVLSIEKEFKNSIKLINLPTIKPIDEEALLGEIKNFKYIIVLEEHNTYCGFGSIIARIVSKKSPKIIKILGIDDFFVQSGKRETVLNSYGLNKQELIKQIKKIIS